MKANSSVDPEEIERFSRISEEWWDPHGKFRPLHRLNPARLAYLRELAVRHFGRNAEDLRPLTGLSLADIGCGGGLVAEPMARMGAEVTGVDASERNIGVASHHAAQSGLAITYRNTTAEALVAEKAQFDMVLALEIVEHVADVSAFVEACAKLVKPGGLLVMSTINRTAKAWLMAIAGAEYVLRWLPRGTHHWGKFLRPSELCRELRRQNLAVKEMAGLVYQPFTGQWELSATDLDVNYLVAAAK